MLLCHLVCSLFRTGRLLTGTRGREHITPVLIELHWLPVRYRIHYKVLLYVFKAVHGLTMSPIELVSVNPVDLCAQMIDYS